jgi:hypothetical protein
MGGVLSLSPMVDVCRTPSFNRLEESYGEDGYLSAVMGTAFVKGLQQGDLKKGVGACSKHYLGYGGGGDADEKEMMEDILLPHETMIRLAGSKALMPGYHAVHGTKCVANSEILNDILRDYLGFDGMVVSDYTAIDQLPGLDTPLQKAVAAINGGNDVDFPRGENYQYLQEALDKGLVKKEVFERAVKDVLRYKIRAGLMDKNPYLYSTEDVKLDTKEERQKIENMEAPVDTAALVRKNDSIQKAMAAETKPRFIPNSNRAIWLALVIPGGGQIYNRKYWKLPIVYGGFVGCAYALTWNNRMYKDYSQAYLDIMDDDPDTKSYEDFLPHGMSAEGMEDTFKKRKDFYRRNRDLSIFCFIGVYILSVIDAYVDAELSDFDISKDLGLQIQPVIFKDGRSRIPNTIGLQCSFKF